MSEKLAKAAEDIADDDVIMEGYKNFFQGKGYFLTKYSALSDAKRKPPKFPTTSKGFAKKWMDAQWFVMTQRKYLLSLANFDEGKSITDSDYTKLKTAYDKWATGYLVVFYGEDARWACNLFVGEALQKAGHTSIMSGGKYLSAKQIWDGVNLKSVKKDNVQRGDIAAFGGSHVEIVTKVRRGQWFEDDEFCSRGAGRGSTGNGSERCDASFNNWFPGSSREINNENIKFFRP